MKQENHELDSEEKDKFWTKKITLRVIYGNSYHRSPSAVGKDIARRIGARGLGLAAKAEDEDPEFHKEQIASLQQSIKNTPDWAKLMIPSMQARLNRHKKRLKQLETFKS